MNTGELLLRVLLAVIGLLLLLLAALDLSRYEMSEFAFKNKLASYSGKEAKLQRMLHARLQKIYALKMLLQITLVSGMAVIVSSLHGAGVGFGYTLLVIVVITAVARVAFVRNLSARLFEGRLERILQVADILKPLWMVTGLSKKAAVQLPGSIEEFTDQLQRLPSTVISPAQRQRLEVVLKSDSLKTTDIMTPKKQVISVEPSATLGPIVLADLQKSEHGYFPVTTPKGHPEGVLALSDVADIQQAKERRRVRDMMNTHIAWVNEESSLRELTEFFLNEKQYIAFVQNEMNEFIGVVTIADVVKHVAGISKD